MMFINRTKELTALNEKWMENKSQLFIIYGKRRVGKTELVKQFIKDKPGVYFLSDKRSIIEQLRELGRLFGEYFHDDILIKNGFNNWLEVFMYLKKNAIDKFIFVVDEYPYLAEADASTSSIFQKGWDEYLKDTKIFLILLGSSVAMMESETLIHKSPLFGRRTAQSLIVPLSFKDAHKFFPRKTFQEFMSIYTITGGMPAYLAQIEPDASVWENIKNKTLNKTSFLYSEVEFALREELREPKNYLSILRAIAWGKRKFGEICNETGLEKNVLNKYLSTLHRLHLIEKEIPATEENSEKSKKGLYQLADNFFRFWFQYIFPYKSDLEIEKYDRISEKFEQDFMILESIVYEKMCQELLRGMEDKFFRLEIVGRWWDRNNEIDIVGINLKTKQIVFGECKWSEKPVGVNIYNDLKKKSTLVNWRKGERKEFFVLFSKSDFTDDMRLLARKERVVLVHGAEVEK